jgi:hypothetical protein
MSKKLFVALTVLSGCIVSCGNGKSKDKPLSDEPKKTEEQKPLPIAPVTVPQNGTPISLENIQGLWLDHWLPIDFKLQIKFEGEKYHAFFQFKGQNPVQEESGTFSIIEGKALSFFPEKGNCALSLFPLFTTLPRLSKDPVIQNTLAEFRTGSLWLLPWNNPAAFVLNPTQAPEFQTGTGCYSVGMDPTVPVTFHEWKFEYPYSGETVPNLDKVTEAMTVGLAVKKNDKEIPIEVQLSRSLCSSEEEALEKRGVIKSIVRPEPLPKFVYAEKTHLNVGGGKSYTEIVISRKSKDDSCLVISFNPQKSEDDLTFSLDENSRLRDHILHISDSLQLM